MGQQSFPHLLYGRLPEAVCNQYGILRIGGGEYAVNVSLKTSSLLTVLVDHVVRHNRYIGFVGIEITFYNQVILIMFKCPEYLKSLVSTARIGICVINCRHFYTLQLE